MTEHKKGRAVETKQHEDEEEDTDIRPVGRENKVSNKKKKEEEKKDDRKSLLSLSRCPH